jgi:cytochrome c oxidase assembly factor CtaG
MKSIFFEWHFDPPTILFLIALCVIYLYAIGFKLINRSLYFFAAIFLLIVCIDSPLHFLGESYLFSAHMLSHVLIILIAAPLIVAGIPEENKFKKSFHFFSRKIKNPIICWFTGVSIMWFWHIPYIFNLLFSMNEMWLMNLEMLSLLLAGIIFCLPIINPYKENRIAPIEGVLYLSTACVFCSLLGLMITFAPGGMYSHMNMVANERYLSIIRNEWNISASVDQQIAGLIMWVPGCFIYLSASMFLLIKWFNNYTNYSGTNYSGTNYSSTNYTNYTN